jgi:hypothetical protein
MTTPGFEPTREIPSKFPLLLDLLGHAETDWESLTSILTTRSTHSLSLANAYTARMSLNDEEIVKGPAIPGL